MFALLLSKLIPPVLAANGAHVMRLRLCAPLSAPGAHKLTLLSAPAGSGKTSLLAEWLAEMRASGQAFGWLSLDDGDNNPARFLRYLLEMFEACHPGSAADLRSLCEIEAPLEEIHPAMVALLNRAREGKPDWTLALDNYDRIQNTCVHALVALLVEQLPEGAHIVISTRSEPLLPLARWRAAGLLAELRWSELAFTRMEGRAFFHAAGIALSAAESDMLVERSEGWIAALQLAAAEMRVQANSGELVRAFGGSQRHLLNYVGAELLQRHSSPLQTFMLETSILEQLCAPLCDALTLCADSLQLIRELEQSNLLLPGSGGLRWMRYPQLLRQFLQTRAQESGLYLPVLHRRAAAWYEGEGMIDEAIHHLLQARDFRTAARLVDVHAQEWMRSGALWTIRRALESLPDSERRSRAGLCLWAAWYQALSGEGGAAEFHLQRLEALQKMEDPLGDAEACQRAIALGYAGQAAAIRCRIALYQSNQPEAINQARLALERLPASDLRVRTVVNISLGDAYLACGDDAAAEAALLDACHNGRQLEHPYIQLHTAAQLANLYVRQGRLHAAQDVCHSVLAGTDVHALAALSGEIHGHLAQVHAEWNALDAAMAHAQQAIALGEQSGWPGLCHIFLLCATLEKARARSEGAGVFVARASEQARAQGSHELQSWVEAVQARLWLQQGRLPPASQWAMRLTSEVCHAHTPLSFYTRLTLARVRIAEQRPDEALALLAPLCSQSRSSSEVERLLLLALAHHARSDRASARRLLAEALALGEPEDFVRVFVVEGDALRSLLSAQRAAIERRQPHLRAYLARLLRAFPTPKAMPSPSVLTERELEVLAQMARGQSNRELAQCLRLAQSTIEWHAKNIFSKLQVHSRTQAVAQAREMGLID